MVHLQLSHNKFSMDGAMAGAKSFERGGGGRGGGGDIKTLSNGEK